MRYELTDHEWTAINDPRYARGGGFYLARLCSATRVHLGNQSAFLVGQSSKEGRDESASLDKRVNAAVALAHREGRFTFTSRRDN